MEEDTRNSCCHHHDEEEMQTHVHEFLGSVKVVPEENEEDFHNHRFAGVSFEVIRTGPYKHKHKIFSRTDFFDDHFHEICIETEENISVGDGKHVHFASGTTTEVENHTHDFVFATLIEDPISY